MSKQKAPKLDVEQEAAQVYSDTRAIFSEYRSGSIKREDAEALTNNIGKSIKALSLVQNERAFEFQQRIFDHKIRTLEAAPAESLPAPK